MDESTSDRPQLQCPTCGYNLRGLQPDRDGVFRCPECGGLVDIMGIVQRHQCRIHGERKLWTALIATLVAFGIIAILPSTVPAKVFSSSGAVLLRFGICFVISLLYVTRITLVSLQSALAPAIILAVILAVPSDAVANSPVWRFVLVPVVVVAVHLWAADREIKRWSR